jgi:tRNA-specific 2-thiouridylase
LDCEFIATGHYAKIREENGRYVISKGVDSTKDQSYVLWGVSQESLSRTILPLGGYTKEQIRNMAKQKGFYDLVNKSESYEICFVPDNDYRGFLKRRVEGLEERVNGGNFVMESGEIVGKHEGYPFYTIGQRKGLKIAMGYPVFVTEIRKETNEVVLGTEDYLLKNAMTVGKLNLQKYAILPESGLQTVTKIRYKDKGQSAFIKQIEADKIEARFDESVAAIAPGQAAVFYEGDDVIGGGWILKNFRI